MRIPTNKVKDIIRFAKQELSLIYSEKEIQSFVFMLFQHFVGWNSSKVLLGKENTVNESDLLKFNFAIKDLKNNKPIQYIIGEAEFYGLLFSVDQSTLIPRQETEELVEMILHNHPQKNVTLLDIGTGSGCIAIAVKKNAPSTQVKALDFSAKTLQKAIENAAKHHVEIEFSIFDITSKENDSYLNQTFDIIVSNPPYVRNSEKVDMRDNVLNYEPPFALFAPDDDALFFYRHILCFADKHLKHGGHLYLEINEALGEELLDLLQEKKYSGKLIQDINGKNRFVEAVFLDNSPS